MNGVGRAKELQKRQMWQPSQFCTGGRVGKGQLEDSWTGTAIEIGLVSRSRELAVVRSRYQAATNEDTGLEKT
jgi:hypothetical protein